MKKSDLVKNVAQDLGMDRNALEVVLNRTLGAISDALAAGEQVTINGFGSFVVKTRAARQGRNPRTGETIQIAESKNVSFKAQKALKEQVNN